MVKLRNAELQKENISLLTAVWETERKTDCIWQDYDLKKGAEEKIDKSDSAKANRYIGPHH